MSALKKICVVGATGLVGSSIVRSALEKGYLVNGTLRILNMPDRLQYLNKLTNSNHLEVFESDMSSQDTFLKPLQGTDACFIASLIPTYFGKDGTPAKEMNDEKGYKEIIQPTVDGCLNILKAAKIQGLKHIVICSSTSSTNPTIPVLIKNENDHWSDENKQYSDKKYTSAAKTVMEKAAIKFCEENNMRLSIILPTGLYGDGILPEHMNHNPFVWLKRLIEGGQPRHDKTPNSSISMIHLRDLANLFLAAYETSTASGRYFGVYKSLHWQDIYTECQKYIPNMIMPDPIVGKLVNPTQFNFERRDSLNVKIRDFTSTLESTINWIKSKPFD